MKSLYLTLLLLGIIGYSCNETTTTIQSTQTTITDSSVTTTHISSTKDPIISLEIPNFSEGGIPNIPIYLQLKNKKWTWKLVDEDFDGNDFAAGLEVLVGLAKVGQEGGRNYWLIEDVMSSPQTIRGLVIEIVRLAVTYKEQEGTLAMELDIQFRLGTEVRSGANGATGIETNLEKDKRVQLMAALFEQGESVRTGFKMTQVWTQSTLNDLTTPLISRKFLFINENNTLTTNELSRESPDVINNIFDPGMDGIFGGKADWKLITNETEFCKAL